jgi:hypothetical protein
VDALVATCTARLAVGVTAEPELWRSRVAICQGGCEQYSAGGCLKFPHPCSRWRRWEEIVLIGYCAKFKPGSGQEDR